MMKTNFVLLLMAVCLQVQAAVNKKPFTVPELKEWKGSEGTFALTPTSTVTYADVTLEDVAQQATQWLGITSKATLGKATDGCIHQKTV